MKNKNVNRINIIRSFYSTIHKNHIYKTPHECCPILELELANTFTLLTSFFDFSSSELKLLSNKAKNKFNTIKLPMTSVGKKMAKHVEAPSWKNRSLKVFDCVQRKVVV